MTTRKPVKRKTKPKAKGKGAEAWEFWGKAEKSKSGNAINFKANKEHKDKAISFFTIPIKTLNELMLGSKSFVPVSIPPPKDQQGA